MLFGSPCGAQGQGKSKVDIKNFGKPEVCSGDKKNWSYFEFVVVNWFNSPYNVTEEWLSEAAASPTLLQLVTEGRRDADMG